MELTIDQALQKAVSAHQSGDLLSAERLYQAILAAQPNHPDANHNLGILALGMGKVDKALPFFKAALKVNSEHGQYWMSYIHALIRANLLVEAKNALKEARRLVLSAEQEIQIEQKLQEVKLKQKNIKKEKIKNNQVSNATKVKVVHNAPASPSAQEINAVFSDYNSGKFDLVKKSAELLTAKYPTHPFGWKALSAILLHIGRRQDALASTQKVALLCPKEADAHSNLGAVFSDLGRYSEAEASHRQAIALKPDFAEAHSYLGNALRDLGRYSKAEASYRQAIALKPDDAETHSNLGAVLSDLGRYSEAETSYRQAIALKPDYAGAHNNLGNALRDLGRYSEAEASLRQAIALKPVLAGVHNNLGTVLSDLGRYSEAEASFRQAIALKPDYAEANSNLLSSLNYVDSLSPIKAMEEARRYGLAVSSKANPKLTFGGTTSTKSKIRIGFVSGDLKNHPVGYFIEGLMKYLNKEQFELFAFPTKSLSDELTVRIKSYFNEWIPIYGKSDFEAANLVHQKDIQILIDLSGHTVGNRLPIFSYKPAPIQASWLGYFATTGLPEIDYILGDPYVTPQYEEHHFSEKVWRLPESYICFSPPIEQITVHGLPAIENQFITFGCFNNLSKMGDQVIKTWATILISLPSSKLLLKTKQLNDPTVVQEVYKKFASHGITPDRLLLEGSSPRAKLLATYNRVDIALDPFPYPGGTTSIEALWMSVPVLTLKGNRFLSHVGETIAHNAGQVEWIAKDLDDYVKKAISFASDVENLSELRRCLRDKVLKSPLLNSERFASHFSKAALSMWENYSKGDIK